MKKTTKSAVIGKHINSLLVYTTMVENASVKGDSEKMCNAMRWYNEAADALIGMGIPVVKYNPEV